MSVWAYARRQGQESVAWYGGLGLLPPPGDHSDERLREEAPSSRLLLRRETIPMSACAKRPPARASSSAGRPFR